MKGYSLGIKDLLIFTFLFVMGLATQGNAQVVIEERMELTTDLKPRSAQKQKAIFTSSANEPISYVVEKSGPLKIVFEKGRRFKDAFAKNTKITISITDSEGKVKYKRKVFPGDFFSEPIQGRLTPQCTDMWHLYGEGPFEWNSGSSTQVIDDAQVFSLGCSTDWAQRNGRCRTTNFGSGGGLKAIAWTYSGDPALTRSFVRFQGLEFTGPVQLDEAVLKLYEIGGQWGSWPLSGSNAFYISRVTSDWSEYAVTWNTQPSQGPPRVSGPGGTGNAEVEVSSIVQSWIDNPGSNYGFGLALKNEQYYRNRSFHDSEGQIPPQLSVKVSNPEARSDTLYVSYVSQGDEVTIEYESNGDVFASNIETVKTINNEEVFGRQFIFNVAGPACGSHGFSERLQAFGWVDSSPLSIKIPEPKKAWPTLLSDDVHPRFDDLSRVDNTVENIKVSVTKNGKPVANQKVQIKAKWIPFKGGHDHGGNENSTPTLNNMGIFRLTGSNQEYKGRISATTMPEGTVQLNYDTPEFGGEVELVATTKLDGKQLEARDTLLIRVPNLKLLPNSSDYKKIGGTCNHNGPRLDGRYQGCKDVDNNHWAHPTVVTWLDSIAVRYHRQYPDEKVIRYNDISLPNGGGFDIGAR